MTPRRLTSVYATKNKLNNEAPLETPRSLNKLSNNTWPTPKPEGVMGTAEPIIPMGMIENIFKKDNPSGKNGAAISQNPTKIII